MATQIVDTDGHIFERDEIMFEYLEPPYRGRKEVLLYPFFPTPDGFHRMARRIVDKRPYVVGEDDPKTWAEVACRAYNDMMADRYIKFDRRLGAVAVLPIQDIEESAKELRRGVKDLHMAGGVLAPAGFPKPLGDAYFDSLYREAEKLGCPLAIHGAPSKGLGFDFFQSLIEARTLSKSFFADDPAHEHCLGGCSGAFSQTHIGGFGGGLSMDSFSDGPYGYGVRPSLSPGSAAKEKTQ